MVLGKRKSRFGNRRFTKRRRTTTRSKSRMYRSLAVRKNPIYQFKRSFFRGAHTLSNLADTFGTFVFKLFDLPNYNEFSNLFDRYRICGVAISLIPQWTSNDLNPSTSAETTNPQIYSVIDHTEDAAPANINELFEYSTFKMTRGSWVHKRYVKPTVLASGFESTVSTAYMPKYKQWLTTDDSATPHYGLKYAIDKIGSSVSTMRVKIYMTYYIQCMNVK